MVCLSKYYFFLKSGTFEVATIWMFVTAVSSSDVSEQFPSQGGFPGKHGEERSRQLKGPCLLVWRYISDILKGAGGGVLVWLGFAMLVIHCSDRLPVGKHLFPVFTQRLASTFCMNLSVTPMEQRPSGFLFSMRLDISLFHLTINQQAKRR